MEVEPVQVICTEHLLADFPGRKFANSIEPPVGFSYAVSELSFERTFGLELDDDRSGELLKRQVVVFGLDGELAREAVAEGVLRAAAFALLGAGTG